jgi:hypothetical protein
MENDSDIKRMPVTDLSSVPPEVMRDGLSAAALPVELEQDSTSEQEAKDAAVMADVEQNDSEEATIAKKNGWTPMQAIKQKCIDCSCGQQKERLLCAVKGCPLWPFRKGRKPIKRHVSEEQRAAMGERFRKFRREKKQADGVT